VRDLNGLSETDFLGKLAESFHVKEMAAIHRPGKMHEFSMYLNKKWYALEIKKVAHLPNDPVSYLDAALLTELILNPILGIQDIRNDQRIDFVGGHEGMEKLQQLVDNKKMAVAFGLFPVTMDHLKKIADAGQVMPPKSTWIEPKLRSGLTIYSLNERQ
jgi:uncharacterized protein (DUF1015 family)